MILRRNKWQTIKFRLQHPSPPARTLEVMVVQAVDISSASSSRLNIPPLPINICRPQPMFITEARVTVCLLLLAKGKVSHLAQIPVLDRETLRTHTACSRTAVTVTVTLLLYSVTSFHDTHVKVTSHGSWFLLISHQQYLLIGQATVRRIALQLVNKCGSSKNKFICAYKYSVTGIIIARLFL